eukprot:217349_1
MAGCGGGCGRRGGGKVFGGRRGGGEGSESENDDQMEYDERIWNSNTNNKENKNRSNVSDLGGVVLHRIDSDCDQNAMNCDDEPTKKFNRYARLSYLFGLSIMGFRQILLIMGSMCADERLWWHCNGIAICKSLIKGTILLFLRKQILQFILILLLICGC